MRKDETIQGETHSLEYGYDLAGRLVEVIEDGSLTTAYEYDLNGNRLRLTATDGTDLTGTYDDQDRLLTYGDATYRHTAAGELQSKTEGGETTTYRYDALGNLRQVVLPDGREIEYLVDGRNRRVAKYLDGVMERGWIWLDQLKPLAEVDGEGNVVSEFVYAGGVNAPEYLVQGGTAYRLVKDHLGSVRLVVNAATGEVAQRIDYGPWGEVRQDTNPGFQPFGFAGGLYDPGTGLVRFGARDYDPETGRWTEKDPIGLKGGLLLYGYVMDDPLNQLDPIGLVCGPKGWLDPIIPDSWLHPLTYLPMPLTSFDFEDACQKHDNCYSAVHVPKEKCDQLFLLNMKEACEDSTDQDNCDDLAETYFEFVRDRGAGPYDAAHSETMAGLSSLNIADVWASIAAISADVGTISRHGLQHFVP